MKLWLLLLWVLIFSNHVLAEPETPPAQSSEVNSDVSDDDWGNEWGEEQLDEVNSQSDFWGFIEGAYGRRITNSSVVNAQETLEELRGRLAFSYQAQNWRFDSKVEAIQDELFDNSSLKLRTANLSINMSENIETKIGRQILTWGTGDYLFLNDLFPKDWQSFFSGRDDEYLKSSSDSIKTSWFNGNSSIQLVWTPEFTPDKTINGSRFSYFSPVLGTSTRSQLTPNSASDSTFSLKVSTSVNSIDYAIYGYTGRWKTPVGVTQQQSLYYPELNVWGASVQAPLANGLMNAEFAWYVSKEDRHGTNPFIANSQFKALVGYGQELFSNFTAGWQYYLEHTSNHNRLLKYSLWPEFETKKNRQLVTLRLNWRVMQQKLTFGLFTFWSPSDHDVYLKPSLSYRYSDRWKFDAGLNLFMGKHEYSFFAQHEDNSNFWIRIKATF
ncbi:MAG: hypothetical protein HAW66_03430 [Shewanella sp.]|nr:hypothetical protein [Shewanella sp.]